MLESNLDALVENLLSAYGLDLPAVMLRRFGKSSFRPDFIARAPGGLRTAIDVRKGGVDAKALYLLFAWWDEAVARRSIDRLLLVTPEPPSSGDLTRFETTFEADENVRWIGIDQLPSILGIPDELDLASPETLDRLKTASLTRKARTYSPDVIGVRVVEEPRTAAASRLAELKVPKSLARQLSMKSLIELARTGETIDTALRFGEEIRVYGLLSDIKSFSTLVRVGDPGAVQEMMSSYYRRAREIIWSHQGVLDKFIGDAVLAIWGYPEDTERDGFNAVRAAVDMVDLGRSLLDEFQSRHNEVIESGTRVGIASDEVLVLNIGADQAEISFVGNAINLAARLEAACTVDGILIDNRTHASLQNIDPDLHALATATQRVLDQQHAKGQLTSIRAWQIDRDGIQRMLQAKTAATAR